MPIYHHHRLVHIHIPKTGGTAVSRLFDQRGDMQRNPHGLYGERFSHNRWFEFQHLTAGEIRTQTDRNFTGYDWFALVRDPYQRLISDYRWRTSIAAAYPDSPIEAYDSFDAFIAAIPSDLEHQWHIHIEGADKTRANLLIHTRPQYHFLADTDIVTDTSITILRFEDLPGSISPFLSDRGIKSHELRRPKNHPVAEYYTTHTISRVNDIYARDFEMLSYPMIDETLT